MCKRFELGKLVATIGVHERKDEDKDFARFVSESLMRYIACDWGDIDKDDAKQNDESIGQGERILAAYIHSDGTKIWIITEWDRSCTTILFPSEY